jgi:two-component system chemotaxis response regulator CheY
MIPSMLRAQGRGGIGDTVTVSLEKLRFLIVDDNVHMQQLVKAILKGFGARMVFEAKDGEQALHHLKHESIDIIILDYVMGEEDGVGFIRRIRGGGECPTPYVSIIMLTAHSEMSRVQLARDAGANEFCSKPITAAELHRKIAAVIDHPRPFVRTDGYFGPDRRRHDDASYDGPERRAERREAAESPEET